jgi:hypothetical protein
LIGRGRSARNLAQQLHHSAIVLLLTKSLAEEENADQLLNQVAMPLMSVAKMPATVEQITAHFVSMRVLPGRALSFKPAGVEPFCSGRRSAADGRGSHV